jgi:hypothetical protein
MLRIKKARLAAGPSLKFEEFKMTLGDAQDHQHDHKAERHAQQP